MAHREAQNARLVLRQLQRAEGLASLRGDASTQLRRALAGRTVRGGQDDMLRVEAAAPGFAGYYLDANEDLVLLLKSGSPSCPDLVRALVDDTYSHSASEVVRALTVDARRAKVSTARHSLSELMEYEQRLLTNGASIPGFTGAGVAVHRNVVVVDVAAASDSAGVRRFAQTLGVPDNALDVSISGPSHFTGTWQDVHRPTKAGIQIQIYDGRYDSHNPDTLRAFYQSLGFNVRQDDQAGQPTGFLTVAHGPNAWFATNGMTGIQIFQPYYPWAAIGSITTNPPWPTTGCAYAGIAFDFCQTADAALGTYANGTTGLRAVGTSNTQGDDGNAGSASINGWYAISDVVPVDLIPVGRRNIFKSGMNTGTTSGTFGVAHYYASDTLLAWGDPRNPAMKKLLLWEQVRVDSMGFGFGDSGGAGFVHVTKGGVCNPYCALGLESTGRGTMNPLTGRCTSGKGCSVVFSEWSEIQLVLGLGRLNPKTTP